MEKSRSLDWRIVYYILILVLLILANTVLIAITQKNVRESQDKVRAVQLVLDDLDAVESGVLRGWDVGLRGYAVTGTVNMLDPYNYAFIFGAEIIERCREASSVVGMSSADIDELEILLRSYGHYNREMKSLLDAGKEDEFRKRLILDYGLQIWNQYNDIRVKYKETFETDIARTNLGVSRLQERSFITQGLSASLAALLVFLLYRKIRSFGNQQSSYINQIEEANKALATHKENLQNEVRWKTKDLEETNRVLHKTLEDMRTMQSYLLQSEKMTALGTMTTGMAHEFNNALNQINGGYHIFRKKVEELAQQGITELESCEEAMSMFGAGVGRIQRIVKAMQVFSQVGTSDFVEKDFNDLLDNALVILGSRIDDDVELRRDVERPLPLRLQQANMLQVILQLLDNAIYAMNAIGGRKLLEISSKKIEDTVEISFVNTGKPIPEEHLREIFDPFFTTKDPGIGTGLGLSVCYSIVMSHGGEIQAQNLDNDLVVFRIVLPLKTPQSATVDTSVALSNSH